MASADTARLALRNLRVGRPDGTFILDIAGLKAEPGQCIGVRGPSGAGKSMLLMAMAGLLEGAAGDLRWGQTDLLTRNSGARAAFRQTHVGMIFQDFLLFDELSALANASVSVGFVKVGERAADREAKDPCVQNVECVVVARHLMLLIITPGNLIMPLPLLIINACSTS